MCSEHSTVRGILENLPEDDAVTLLDMGASPEPFARGTPKAASTMVVVAEPYYKALEAAVRLVDLSREMQIPRIGLVANKVRDGEQKAAVEQVCESRGIQLWGVVPYSEEMAAADIQGTAALDFLQEDSPAMIEIQRLTKILFANGPVTPELSSAPAAPKP